MVRRRPAIGRRPERLTAPAAPGRAAMPAARATVSAAGPVMVPPPGAYRTAPQEEHPMANPTSTRNDLAGNAKQVSIGILQACLVDTVDLYNATRQAHWNVKGPGFIALHEMFGTFYTDLQELADDMAERIVQLGGTASGTTQAVAGGTRLPPYPADIRAEAAHLAALADRYAQLANALRAGIDSTAEAGDADSADLLTGASRSLDKKLWMLEAHLPGA
jgi:starvation-inducible DNA-binding protein